MEVGDKVLEDEVDFGISENLTEKYVLEPTIYSAKCIIESGLGVLSMGVGAVMNSLQDPNTFGSYLLGIGGLLIGHTAISTVRYAMRKNSD